MEVVTYSDARASLKDVMDRVVADHTPAIISRRKAGSVVMVSLDDWNAMNETNYLLSTPENARELRASIAEAEAGRVQERPLHQP